MEVFSAEAGRHLAFRKAGTQSHRVCFADSLAAEKIGRQLFILILKLLYWSGNVSLAFSMDTRIKLEYVWRIYLFCS